MGSGRWLKEDLGLTSDQLPVPNLEAHEPTSPRAREPKSASRSARPRASELRGEAKRCRASTTSFGGEGGRIDRWEKEEREQERSKESAIADSEPSRYSGGFRTHRCLRGAAFARGTRTRKGAGGRRGAGGHRGIGSKEPPRSYRSHTDTTTTGAAAGNPLPPPLAA
ncbi:hypothetical protein KM043_012242 [Ampulex compressa]|nr:hypothetical protein KM043_012242 [Ampulex compressa]